MQQKKFNVHVNGNVAGNAEISNIFGSEIAINKCTVSLYLQSIPNCLLLCGVFYDVADVVNGIKINQMSNE